MKLTCFLISKYLAEHPGPWVTCHLAGCASCRAKAEAFAHLRAAITQAVRPEGECPVTWREVAARLDQAQPHALAAHRLPILPVAVLSALVAVAVLAALFMHNRYAEKTPPMVISTKQSPPVVVKQPAGPSTVMKQPEPALSVKPAGVSPVRSVTPHREQRRRHRPVEPLPTGQQRARVQANDENLDTPEVNTDRQPSPTALDDPRLIALSERSGSVAAQALISLSAQMTEEKSAAIQQKLIELLSAALPKKTGLN